ncbi:MAG TPA: histidinol-phosphatase HisJ family protein [Thermoanaerobaculia bacterium]|nr:histidinol-phosphatase HisJ family protein [Thermoanaerobaculia bacterium]
MASVIALPDYHVHTFRCGHAGGESRDFVRRAIERGLSEMAFTDHIPLYFLPPDQRDPAFAMREDQFDDYLGEVAALQREFAGSIPIRLGLEADYAEGCEEELERWLQRADWDLVLGSVHWVAGDWIDSPASAARRFEREGARALYAEYYRLLANAAATGFFDVLTHFDLPKKHGHRPSAPLERAEDAAIAAAKDSGCAVEISSAGLRKPVAEAYPEPRLLTKIVAVGVPVTFSSDAHAPAEVGWGYEKTLELARSCGVDEYVTIEKRRKTPHALPEPAKD